VQREGNSSNLVHALIRHSVKSNKKSPYVKTMLICLSVT